MRLAEVDGKALLRRHGIAVPRSVLLQSGENPPDATADWPGLFLKAQVLQGGRGKSGLVRRLDKAGDLRDARRLILATVDDADMTQAIHQRLAPRVRIPGRCAYYGVTSAGARAKPR